MPCYNEEELVAETVRQLLGAFAGAGHRLELIAVDNGSVDRTGEILRELAERHTEVVPTRVEVNQGYGFGILSGLPLCTAPWVGLICADGQVEAVDVVKLFEVAARARSPRLVKVRRRFRMDGLRRKVTSIAYNVFTAVLFGGLGSIDVNGNPKIMPRSYVDRMRLQSRDWFLDAEIMIKAKRLGLEVLELNVMAMMRTGGKSNVRPSTCWEFLLNLLRYRFGDAGRVEPASVAPVQPLDVTKARSSS